MIRGVTLVHSHVKPQVVRRMNKRVGFFLIVLGSRPRRRNEGWHGIRKYVEKRWVYGKSGERLVVAASFIWFDTRPEEHKPLYTSRLGKSNLLRLLMTPHPPAPTESANMSSRVVEWLFWAKPASKARRTLAASASPSATVIPVVIVFLSSAAERVCARRVV